MQLFPLQFQYLKWNAQQIRIVQAESHAWMRNARTPVKQLTHVPQMLSVLSTTPFLSVPCLAHVCQVLLEKETNAVTKYVSSSDCFSDKAHTFYSKNDLLLQLFPKLLAVNQTKNAQIMKLVIMETASIHAPLQIPAVQMLYALMKTTEQTADVPQDLLGIHSADASYVS